MEQNVSANAAHTLSATARQPDLFAADLNEATRLTVSTPSRIVCEAEQLRLLTAIRKIAADYRQQLATNIKQRVVDMAAEDAAHQLVYDVLGVPAAEGRQIDLYQNKGRLLYRHAGSFIEHAVKLCLQTAFPLARSLRIPNPAGGKPSTYEIDCVIGQYAIEIKWKDGTTDGDHVLKELARLKAIAALGYTPVRLMFYESNRSQAARIQNNLADMYKKVGGQYFSGPAAWRYVSSLTGIDLNALLCQIANDPDSAVACSQ